MYFDSIFFALRLTNYEPVEDDFQRIPFIIKKDPFKGLCILLAYEDRMERSKCEELVATYVK